NTDFLAIGHLLSPRCAAVDRSQRPANLGHARHNSALWPPLRYNPFSRNMERLEVSSQRWRHASGNWRRLRKRVFNMGEVKLQVRRAECSALSTRLCVAISVLLCPLGARAADTLTQTDVFTAG